MQPRIFEVLVGLIVVLGCNHGTQATAEGLSESQSSGSNTETAPSEETAATSVAADDTGERYHPAGFLQPEMHGPPMKLHTEDCRTCHGDDLKGGTSAVSCDSCHEPQWRTDCVFCHGGDEEPSGAPPRDIDGTNDVSMLSFIAHGRHVTQHQHAPYDCSQCHRKPDDVLSVGHIFDDTPAVAEVEFLAGISPAAQWDNNGGCSVLYCHGDGQASNGSFSHDEPMPNCGGCHPYPGTENTQYAAMSGEHARHMNENLSCTECHDPLAITAHVDGNKDVAIAAAGVTFNAASTTCSGVCHLQGHNNDGW